jgi:hypothetical protein
MRSGIIARAPCPHSRPECRPFLLAASQGPLALNAPRISRDLANDRDALIIPVGRWRENALLQDAIWRAEQAQRFACRSSHRKATGVRADIVGQSQGIRKFML